MALSSSACFLRNSARAPRERSVPEHGWALSDGSCGWPARGSFRRTWGGAICRDEEWARSELHLPRNTGRGGRWKSHRRVINGTLCRLRTGIPVGGGVSAAIIVTKTEGAAEGEQDDFRAGDGGGVRWG